MNKQKVQIYVSNNINENQQQQDNPPKNNKNEEKEKINKNTSLGSDNLITITSKYEENPSYHSIDDYNSKIESTCEFKKVMEIFCKNCPNNDYTRGKY